MSCAPFTPGTFRIGDDRIRANRRSWVGKIGAVWTLEPCEFARSWEFLARSLLSRPGRQYALDPNVCQACNTTYCALLLGHSQDVDVHFVIMRSQTCGQVGGGLCDRLPLHRRR